MSLKITDRTAEKAFFISRELWEHPELSGEEYRSAEFLAEQIAAEGFQVTKGGCRPSLSLRSTTRCQATGN